MNKLHPGVYQDIPLTYAGMRIGKAKVIVYENDPPHVLAVIDDEKFNSLLDASFHNRFVIKNEIPVEIKRYPKVTKKQ